MQDEALGDSIAAWSRQNPDGPKRTPDKFINGALIQTLWAFTSKLEMAMWINPRGPDREPWARVKAEYIAACAKADIEDVKRIGKEVDERLGTYA